MHEDDEVWREISLPAADLVFGPQGLGNHADHLQVRRSLGARCVFYQDAPYAIRVGARSPLFVNTGALQEQKLWAIEAYVTQVPFQFGSADNACDACDVEERFQVSDPTLLERWRGFEFPTAEDTREAT